MGEDEKKMHRESLILEESLYDRLTEFCRRTTRAKATVIRELIRTFLGEGEEGFQRADRALSQRLYLWDTANKHPACVDEDKIERAVTGKPARKKSAG